MKTPLTCDIVRESLRECFDNTEPVPEAIAYHAQQCTSCNAYHHQLNRLNAALNHLPVLEQPETMKWVPCSQIISPRGWLLGAVAAVLLAVVVGWWRPLDMDLLLWGQNTITYLSELSVQDRVTQATQIFSETITAYKMPEFDYSPFILWSLAALFAMILVGINGFEAFRPQQERSHPFVRTVFRRKSH